jgi:hypothetical protein
LSIYDVEWSKRRSYRKWDARKTRLPKPQSLETGGITQKVVTGDALHTQRGLAAQILDAQADYVLPVKENQP